MKFGDSSSLFGNEKDDSFKGNIATIYQSFDTLVAPTIMIAESNPEEKEMMISVIMNYIK